MKIATMVRGYIPAPRPNDLIYAPIDLAVSISEILTKRGHEVTYFGPNGTHLGARVETLNLRPLAHNVEEFRTLLGDSEMMSHSVPAMWDYFMAREMFARARDGEFDLLHFHHPEVALPYLHLYPDVPVVFTLHDPTEAWTREVLEMYAGEHVQCISISNNQRRPAPDLKYLATVYNGVDMDVFPFSEERDDYLLFVGRIVPEKGVREAVQVAMETGDRLMILGPTYPDHQDYFDRHIKPFLSERILYLGFVERELTARYYQKAKALLAPIQWEEPFGLTMVEAMACGTPVIAIGRGSVPEIVSNGKTGYVVSSVTDMAEAVKKIGKIDPQYCRKYVEERFSLERMVDGYEAAFEKILGVKKEPKRNGAKAQVKSGVKKS